MAKKSTRVLSFLLAILMVATMTSVIASAQYTYDETAFNSGYYSVAYDTLVGTSNQTRKGVYIVNSSWNYTTANAPAAVSFYFRGTTVTENYNPARHLTSVAAVYTQAANDGIKVPTCILTAGTYSTAIKLTGGIVLLGANAGINPNVPSADPTAEWGLNPARYLPSLLDSNSKNETRFWLPGGKDFDARSGSGNVADTIQLISITATTSGTKNYVIDGLTLQGYGAVIADTSSGAGIHNVYVQNCIMNNGYSQDCEMLRFWGRGSGNTCQKKLYLANSYITGQKNLALYSGHASAIRIKGISYQQSDCGAFYNTNTLQWQGFSFELKDSHFWNPDGFSMCTRYPTDTGRGIQIQLQHTAQSQAMTGTNNEPFRYNISNNTFYNATAMRQVTGTQTYQQLGDLFEIPMAGTNELVEFNNNTFVSTYNTVNGAINPLRIKYLFIKGTSIISHASTADLTNSKDGDYALNNTNLRISGNTYIGAQYQAVPAIGVNNHKDTLVQMTGNLYLNDLSATTGNIIPGTNKVYDQWVWTDAAMTEKSSALFTDDFHVLSSGITVSGTAMSMNVGATQYSSTLAFECNPKNSVTIYQSNANFEKGAVLPNYTVDSTARTSYYIVSLQSIDKRTTKDYTLIINRAPNPTSELYGIAPDAAMRVEGQTTTRDVYSYTLNYDNPSFLFTPSVSAGATVVLKNAANGAAINGVGGLFTVPMTQVSTEYHYYMDVTDSNSITERYDLYLIRNKSTHTDVLGVSADSMSVSSNLATKTWRIDLPSTATSLDFDVSISDFASLVLKDTIYGSVLTRNSTGYQINNVAAGETTYNMLVTAQDGVTTTNWKLVTSRPKNAACELYGIDNTTTNNGIYVANVNYARFFVYASSSVSSTYKVYSDAACTQEITNPYLTLTSATTNVWIRVIAEDGVHLSAPAQLTINTTADLSGGNGGVVYKPMVSNDYIGVTGANAFSNSASEITVNLDQNTTQFFLKVIGYNGYEVHLYSDVNKKVETSIEQIINLDAGYTRLYVEATKGSEKHGYNLIIRAPRAYTYSDSITAWAQQYVQGLNSKGYGLLRGDENSAFRGDANLTRNEMATILVRLMGLNKEMFANVRLPFSDSIADWAESYVKAAYKMGLVSGYAVTDTAGNVTGYVFNGNNNSTRSEFIRVLMNVVCLNVYGKNVDAYYAANKGKIDSDFNARAFSDAGNVATWAIPGIYTAVSMGIMNGDGSAIKPDDYITRNEVAAVLYRTVDGN